MTPAGSTLWTAGPAATSGLACWAAQEVHASHAAQVDHSTAAQAALMLFDRGVGGALPPCQIGLRRLRIRRPALSCLRHEISIESVIMFTPATGHRPQESFGIIIFTSCAQAHLMSEHRRRALRTGPGRAAPERVTVPVAVPHRRLRFDPLSTPMQQPGQWALCQRAQGLSSLTPAS